MQQVAAFAPLVRLNVIPYGIPSYSIVTMGVQPYIYALIVFSLLPIISSTVRAMIEEAEGRRRLDRWMRATAAVIALGQAYGFTMLFQADGVLPPVDWFQRLELILVLAAGTMTLVFIADAMNEFGLGFGYGVFVFYFLTYVPREMGRLGDYLRFAASFNDRSAYEPVLAWIAISLALVAVSVGLTRGRREIELVKGKNVAGSLVFPVLMSGILRPPVFANSIIFIPQLLANYYAAGRPEIANWLALNWTSGGPNPWLDAGFTAIYGALVVAMSCFVAFAEFDPRVIAERLRHDHLGIAEARDEQDASRYLADVGRRLSFAGALVLGVMLAVIPVIARIFTRGPLNEGPSVSAFDALLVSAIVLGVAAAMRKKGNQRLAYVPRVL